MPEFEGTHAVPQIGTSAVLTIYVMYLYIAIVSYTTYSYRLVIIIDM